MFDRSTAGDLGDPHSLTPGGHAEDGMPLEDFPWCDGIVGMGYFPAEVALPSSWSWATNQIRSSAGAAGSRSPSRWPLASLLRLDSYEPSEDE